MGALSDYVTRLDFQEQVNRLFESMEKDRSETIIEEAMR